MGGKEREGKGNGGKVRLEGGEFGVVLCLFLDNIKGINKIRRNVIIMIIIIIRY